MTDPMRLGNLARRGAPVVLATLMAFAAAGCLHDPIARRNDQRTAAFDLLTEGQKLKAQGDYLLARDTFLRAHDVSPRPVIAYEIGNCYYLLGRYPEAVSWYDRALEIQPDYALAKAEKDLAENYIATGSSVPPGEAAAADAPGRSRAGNAAAPDGSAVSSAAGLMEGLAGALSGRPSGEAKAAPDAVAVRSVVFPELLDRESRTPDEWLALGESAIAAGRLDEGARHLEIVLESRPEDVAVMARLAHCYERTGRYARAGELLAAARKLSPESADLAFQEGNLRLQLKERDQARAAFEDALRLNPRHLRALNNISVLRLDDGQYAEAREGFAGVLEIDPAFTPAWLNLALAQDRSGEDPAIVLRSLETYVRQVDKVSPGTERWMRSLRRRLSEAETPPS